jgi:hypothetical protein
VLPSQADEFAKALKDIRSWGEKMRDSLALLFA